LFEQVEAAEHAGRVTYYDRDDPETGLRHRFRFVSDVALNASNTDLPPHSLYKKSQSVISEGPELWVDSIVSP
jgi:hypothetical protein